MFKETIVKSVLKAQEILPLISGGHVLRHDLLTTALMTMTEKCSNNVTSEIAINTSYKPDNSFDKK